MSKSGSGAYHTEALEYISIQRRSTRKVTLAFKAAPHAQIENQKDYCERRSRWRNLVTHTKYDTCCMFVVINMLISLNGRY